MSGGQLRSQSELHALLHLFREHTARSSTFFSILFQNMKPPTPKRCHLNIKEEKILKTEKRKLDFKKLKT
jgi:hypothetical protein